MTHPTTVEEAGEPDRSGTTLLVAVGNPAHVDQLMRTAGDLARQADGSIHVVSVVTKDYDSPVGVFDDETIRREFAGDRRTLLDSALEAGEDVGVSVTGEVVVDRSVSRAVTETATAIGADALLVGWTERTRRSEAVLGTNVDALLERAPLDVYVERIGATADGVEGVLVPVAGQPHAALAARAGHAIARGNGATLTLLSVADEGGEAEAREQIDQAFDALDPVPSTLSGNHEDGDESDRDAVSVDTVVLSEPDVVDAIVTEARNHDVVVMGATRGGPLRARLVGSVPRRVADRTDRTVLLARRWTGPSRMTRLLGRLRRW